jgi:hypothetical protein
MDAKTWAIRYDRRSESDKQLVGDLLAEEAWANGLGFANADEYHRETDAEDQAGALRELQDRVAE